MIPAPNEASIHKAVLEAVRRFLPDDAFIFHIPNEGKRGWKAQREFRSLGGVAGVPDIQIIYRGRSIFLEVKSPSGRLSHAQRQTMQDLTLCGAVVSVVRSVDDALDFLSQVIPMKGRVVA